MVFPGPRVPAVIAIVYVETPGTTTATSVTVNSGAPNVIFAPPSGIVSVPVPSPLKNVSAAGKFKLSSWFPYISPVTSSRT